MGRYLAVAGRPIPKIPGIGDGSGSAAHRGGEGYACANFGIGGGVSECWFGHSLAGHFLQATQVGKGTQGSFGEGSVVAHVERAERVVCLCGSKGYDRMPNPRWLK